MQSSRANTYVNRRRRSKRRAPGGAKESIRQAVNAFFVCNEGTVSHYAHFFFGCLIPLLARDLASEARENYRICTYVGSMTRMLERVFPKRIVEYAEADPGGRISDKQRIFGTFLALKQHP